MLSVSTALSGVNSQARSFYSRSAVEPLADARETFGFRGTPVENHCPRCSQFTFYKHMLFFAANSKHFPTI